ncbi:hypothetical protein SPRG_03820 [Saprolegnia parasitica CBS 223.65]|uniref:Pop1 N-terminal domain-containing protein n=1 Tax=Saprolegnia parasitica (strain CBS 223.65) TaxID=695850 RepID=A0A067CWQ9_SAPPC|nr:hypothetical protein SPRG_03820 [Saprolegnia parasitica CBS 223.65]KDO31202.1 hypothetical protein SPRG_03820 [Saprolegnia parasitica CBS 223.65]|eukprot:XP_012197807.1 hypothetical protein SPRG_03820 [Saprolegnia parasitica CBS 223.65]
MEVVEVLSFATARAPELGELHRASGFEKHGHATLLKRRKDFHLRRRTNAYNSHKFPVRLRNKKRQAADPSVQRCRKHRRRLLLKAKTDYLPTHRWLVKRFVMEHRYGLQVPAHRLDRSISAALDAPATIADVSYTAVIELQGSLDAIEEAITMCMDGDLSPDVLAGAVEGSVVLYHPSCFPLQAIGPVQLMLQPAADDDDTSRVCWVWVHPGIVDEVLHALREAALDGLRIHDRRRKLSRFEIRGKHAGRIMQQLVVPHGTSTALFWPKDDATPVIQTWSACDPRELPLRQPLVATSVSLLATPSDVDKSKVLCPITGDDITAPMDRAALAAEPSLEALSTLFASVMRWANAANQDTTYGDVFPNNPKATKKPTKLAVATDVCASVPVSGLWNHETRLELRRAFVPDHTVNRKPATGRALAPMPLLVVRHAHGYDLITLPEYAPCVLKAGVFATASAIGMDELDALRTRHGLLSFPRDYPDTRAGAAFWASVHASEEAKVASRPKAKRVSYASLQVASPFQPSWASLFELNDAMSPDFCVLRGETYMAPFPFYKPSENAMEDRGFMPMAMPTLICVQLQLPRRGRLDVNAMICMPTDDDVAAFVADRKWSGFMAPTTKQQQKKGTGLAGRACIGYVTSAIETKNKSPILGTGFCHCEALQDVFLPHVANAPLGLVLVRSPTSLQYRPALLSVAA